MSRHKSTHNCRFNRVEKRFHVRNVGARVEEIYSSEKSRKVFIRATSVSTRKVPKIGSSDKGLGRIE